MKGSVGKKENANVISPATDPHDEHGNVDGDKKE